MKLIKRDGRWYVKYKTAAGVWDRFTTGEPISTPQAEAEKIGVRMLQERLSGTSPVRERAVGSILNVAEALESCYLSRWKGTASDIQLKYVVRAMEREVGHWLLADMPGPSGYKRIKDYRDNLVKEGKSKATSNRRMSVLKVALKEALKEGHLSAMPVFPETLDEDNVTERFLTQDEEARALEWLKRRALADSYGNPGTGEWVYMRALVIALLDTGARLSEVLKLKECSGREVIFRGTVSQGELGAQGDAGLRERKRMKKATKSGKSRRVPLTERAAEAIKILLAHPLHGTLKDGPDWCGHRWGFVRRECGIPDVNLHLLRHTFACRLLEKGVDLYVVSKLLGHSSVRITERYGHLARTSGIFEQAISALSNGPVAVRGPTQPEPLHIGNAVPRK